MAQLEEMTREELYELAQEHDVEGRSEMTKDELVEALRVNLKGPDAVDLIIEQHEQIRERFAAFQELSDRPSQRKEDAVRDIITLLSRHAAMEEELFYPAVQDEIPELAEHVEEDLEEHRLVELVLMQLDRMRPKDDTYDAKVRVVIKNVTEHMEEEEADVLPSIRGAIDEERRRELGHAMVAAWETAPTRPHPLTPKHPLVKFIVEPAAAAVDRGTNAARAVRKAISRG
jgi:hemerythrin superfamily protein